MEYALRDKKTTTTNNSPIPKDITVVKDISSPVSIELKDMSPKDISLVSITSVNITGNIEEEIPKEYNGKPVQRKEGAGGITWFWGYNKETGNYDIGLGSSYVTLPEVEIIGKPKKQGFWKKLGNVLYEDVLKNIPVVGGITTAVEKAIEGDVLGAFMGLGEAVLDGVLLVTTAGIGNAVKLGVKTTAKIVIKETAEGYVGGKVSQKLEEAGVNPIFQVAVGVVLGVDIRKGKKKTSGIIDDSSESVGKSINQLNKVVQTGKAPKSIKRFDKGKDINQAVDHVHFIDGSALRKDGVWRHGQRQLTNEETKFLKDNGWAIP